MATAYTDAIDVHPITIVVNAEAWAQGAGDGWFTRCRQLNRLLRGSTHLLRLSTADEKEPIWYAGLAGASIAAGIDRMAIVHESLRNAIVAFPLDTRIYVADVQNGLVREEWVLYPDAFDERVKTWREAGRTFVSLTGGGRQVVDMPNADDLPVDIDTEAMTFQHASLALLGAGLIRWRDCYSLMGVVACAFVISAALAWWQRAPGIEPLQRVSSLVTQDVKPERHTASAELAYLAVLAATHDRALWRDHSATELTYDAGTGMLALTSAISDPITTPIGTLPTLPDPIPIKPYTIYEYQAKLAAHLASSMWTLTFGDPYLVGAGSQLEQHITVAIRPLDESQEVSVASALFDLSALLLRLPITLYQANCGVSDGLISTCDLRFAIRGGSAA